MGIEKNLNAKPTFDALQADLERQAAEWARAQEPVEVDLKVSPRVVGDGKPIPSASPLPKDFHPAGAKEPGWNQEAQNKLWGVRPIAPPLGDYPDPSQAPGGLLGTKAASIWGGIREQGMLYSIREIQGGKFDPWMAHLQGGAKKDAEEVARAARRKEGHQLLEDAEGMTDAGKKITALMKEIEEAGKGTPAAAKASEEVAKLLKTIDRLAESAKNGADAIGGDAGKHAKEEIERLKTQAQGGMIAPDEKQAGGFKFSAGELQAMANNPLGAGASMAQTAIWQRAAAALGARTLFGSGGAFGAMGGGLMGGASMAAAGGAALYGGYKLPGLVTSTMVDGWEQDQGNIFADARTSNLLGASFDLRGSFSDNGNRTVANPYLDLNRRNVRATAAAMDVSFEASGIDEMALYGFMDKDVARRDKKLGLQDGAMAAFLGQSMKSGAVERNYESMLGAVNRVSGLVEDLNKKGISSNEALSTLVHLNQMAESKQGFVSEDTSKYLTGIERILAGSGLKSLRGPQGMQTVGSIVEGGSMEFQAMTLQGLMGNEGKMKSMGLQAFGEKDWQALQDAAGGDQGYLAMKVAETPLARLTAARDWLNGAGRGMSAAQQEIFLSGSLGQGINAPLTLKRLREGEDPAHLADELRVTGRKADAAETEKSKELAHFEGIGAKVSQLADGINQVQMSATNLKNWVDANMKLEHGQASVKRFFTGTVEDAMDPKMLDVLTMGVAGLVRKLTEKVLHSSQK